ncbi:MAG: hypothetical protein IKT67_05130 [Lachnospiraceae bacterium]|nr:hypothetical protein [Lachnospiraceae bacterium]
MKNKKKVIIVGVAIVVCLLLIFGGIEIYKYNTMAYRVGIAKSGDGRLADPVITWSARSEFGASQKAQQKSQEILAEWREKVNTVVLEIHKTYGEDKNRTLNVTVCAVDGKTEIHFFGEGMPNGGTEVERIDETVWLNYEFELDKDVIY